MVLLIGNYPADRQESMQRFGQMMLAGLTNAGVPVELISPTPLLGNFRLLGQFIAKWLGYVDKFILFPRLVRRKIKSGVRIVHICDHSNAMYRRWMGSAPVLVTCHDLLAVRGALGEVPDCPASFTGKILQRWILSSLQRATRVACVSEATRQDARRLIGNGASSPTLDVVPLGLSYPYQPLPSEESAARLRKITGIDFSRPFLLHVGSNEPRKNRAGALRIFSHCADRWDGQLIFAGDPLPPELLTTARELGLRSRVHQVPHPSNETLEALYYQAFAFLFPSRFEGFGWPVIEAQACGCPVLASNAGPIPEVAGEGALLRDVADEAGFADDVVRLADPQEREHWRSRSLANAKRFSATAMVARYMEIYRELAPEV